MPGTAGDAPLRTEICMKMWAAERNPSTEPSIPARKRSRAKYAPTQRHVNQSSGLMCLPQISYLRHVRRILKCMSNGHPHFFLSVHRSEPVSCGYGQQRLNPESEIRESVSESPDPRKPTATRGGCVISVCVCGKAIAVAKVEGLAWGRGASCVRGSGDGVPGGGGRHAPSLH